ncbi:MAG TPA: biotin/lipoyl-binding protein, partial [Pararhizobium sp.]|nr:biotin/lipoyl-binding protein [Pararhizobium sp.]
MAPGVVVVDNASKVVQNLEGGVIAELLVRDGDHVKAGQVLVRLDDLEAKALHDVLKGQWLALAAQRARLLAERDDLQRLAFPAKLEALRGSPEMAEILSGQQRIFDSGRKALEGQIDVLKQRIEAFKAEAAGLRAQLDSSHEQLSLIKEELAGVRGMVEKGLEPRPRLLELQRNASELRGQQGDLKSRIAQVQENASGVALEIINARQARTKQAAIDLRDVETKAAETGERLAEAKAKLARRDV